MYFNFVKKKITKKPPVIVTRCFNAENVPSILSFLVEYKFARASRNGVNELCGIFSTKDIVQPLFHAEVSVLKMLDDVYFIHFEMYFKLLLSLVFELWL